MLEGLSPLKPEDVEFYPGSVLLRLWIPGRGLVFHLALDRWMLQHEVTLFKGAAWLYTFPSVQI